MDLTESDEYKGWPMYSTAAALALDVDLLRSVVGERVAWEAASLPHDAAAARIGWHWRDLVRRGEEGRITNGRGGRYLITDLDTMAAEADGEQYLTAQAAATDVLEIRASDWKYVEAAGWIAPAETYENEVGRTRTVTVALYRLGDVRALLDLPGVGWEAVRGLPKAAPSPLREYAKLAPARADVVRDSAQRLADRHNVTVWAWNSPYSGCWELDWERIEDLPTEAMVRARARQRRGGQLLCLGDHPVPDLGEGHAGGAGAAGARPRGHPRHRDHRPVRPHHRDRRDRRGHRKEAAGHPGQPRGLRDQ
ncbi:hypothetical protein AB0K57_32560 [Streptomyces halstedii]|uniref:hypothetical protein n=1 Tax=Streptomyces halstedii TaxID=1944 RepID=UPI003460CF47